MKRYEKVVGYFWGEDEIMGVYTDKEEHMNVIVLTVEELREVWEAAEKRILSGPVNRNYKGEFLSNNPDFHEFCESKGIKI
jgi:hypothetical protein